MSLGLPDPSEPVRITPAIAAQFAALGRRVAPGKIEKVEKVFKVWDMNWPAVKLFLALSTQWRTAALSTLERSRIVRLGLDYAAVPVVRSELGFKRSPRLFEQLQTLERAALGAFAEAAD